MLLAIVCLCEQDIIIAGNMRGRIVVMNVEERLMKVLCEMYNAIRARFQGFARTENGLVRVFALQHCSSAERRAPIAQQMSLLNEEHHLLDVDDRTTGQPRAEVNGMPAYRGEPGIVRVSLRNGWGLFKTGENKWSFLRSGPEFELELSLWFDSGNLENGPMISSAHTDLFLTLLDSIAPYVKSPDSGSCDLDQAGTGTVLIRKDEPVPVDDMVPPFHGRSRKILRLKKDIRMLAKSGVPVLIEGENGTGKEIVAKNIHNCGPRKDKPLVIVNCMEMPETLLQGELFGHARGSFTGAFVDRKGLMESAAGGTFFLDEIGELSLNLQAALLRAIQEKEIRRLGETERRNIDVRFVFATNRKLAALVKEEKFREDLYFRIKGVRLWIPPLRERRADIMSLARRFLHSATSETGITVPGISADTARLLVSFPWPGNVRELKNEIERIVALYPDTSVIEPGMLSPAIRDNYLDAFSSIDRGEDTLRAAVKKLECLMIEKALDRFDNNRTRSAGCLGITRQGLLKKMKRYGIRDAR